MRRIASFLILGLCLAALASLGLAQNPRPTDPGEKAQKDAGGKGDKGGFQKDAFKKDGGFGKDKGGFGKSGVGRPVPGQLMPEFAAQSLKLTDEQKAKMEAIQKDVDAKLAKILTEEQRAQLKQMKEGAGRPFGFPPGGPGTPPGPPPGQE